MTKLSREKGQLSKYHYCFIFEKFADSVHNKEILKYSSKWWKQLENIQFQGDPSNCLSSPGLRNHRLLLNGSNFVGGPVSRSWCPDLSNHSIMTRQYLSSLELGHGEQDPASLVWPLPLPWPAPGQDKLSAARRNPNNKYFPNIEQSRLRD